MQSNSFAYSLIAIALLLGDQASAFNTGVTNRRQCHISLNAHGDTSSPCDRSAFLKTSFASIAAISTSFLPSIALAADDLAMPTADEQKKQDEVSWYRRYRWTMVCFSAIAVLHHHNPEISTLRVSLKFSKSSMCSSWYIQEGGYLYLLTAWKGITTRVCAVRWVPPFFLGVFLYPNSAIFFILFFFTVFLMLNSHLSKICMYQSQKQ